MSKAKTTTLTPTTPNIQYDVLLEENEAGIFLLHRDIIQYCNPAFRAVVFRSGEALTGTSILNFIAEVDRPPLIEALEAMEKGELKTYSDDLQLLHDGEELRYFSLHLKVHQQDDKLEIIGASRDATKRVLRSLELSKTKAKYEALYRNIPDGIVIYDYMHERILDGNQAALNALGYDDVNELRKKNRFDIIPASSHYFPGLDLHAITRDHGLRVQGGEAFSTMGVFLKKDGQEILCQVNVVPNFYRIGEAYVIFHNITKEVLNRKALQASEQKYRAIFENSHEAIVYTDLNSQRPIVCNQNALLLFGCEDFETFANTDLIQFFADEHIEGLPAYQFYYNKVKEAAENGKAELSFQLKRLNGETAAVEGVLIADLSVPDHPKILSFFRDVSPIYQTQQQLNQKNKELNKYINSNLQLENFAYLASHDLQTPLRSIISFTQLLERSLSGRLSAEEQEFMGFIVNSSKNMQGLINDLLSYSRVNTTKCHPTQVDLCMLIESLLHELRIVIDEKQAQINCDSLPSTLITADRTKLRQIFQNLLTNALKFTSPGVPPVINIRTQETPTHWQFSIADNGIGIAPEFQEKIFLLFKRLHGQNTYEGTGIGLAMVKKLVSQHGGEIWLDSTPGQGTTFHFTIARAL